MPLTNCWIKLLGVWILSDALYSFNLYIKKPEETWLINHWVRAVRFVIGVALIIWG